MRFTIDDLKRGSVSKERIQEIVNHVVYKRIKSQLDGRYYNEEELKRSALWLLQTGVHILIFNKEFDPLKNATNENRISMKM